MQSKMRSLFFFFVFLYVFTLLNKATSLSIVYHYNNKKNQLLTKLKRNKFQAELYRNRYFGIKCEVGKLKKRDPDILQILKYFIGYLLYIYIYIYIVRLLACI